METSTPTQIEPNLGAEPTPRMLVVASRVRANLAAQLFNAQVERTPTVTPARDDMPRSGARSLLSRARNDYVGQLAGRGFNRKERRALAKRVRLS